PSHSVLFLPDGTSLIAFGPSGLWRWPVRSDAEGKRGDLEVGPGQLLARTGSNMEDQACLCPDGRTIVMGDSTHGQAIMLNLEGESGKVLLRGHHSKIAYVSISPDGKWIASGTRQGAGVRIWDSRSGELVRELPGGPAQVAFSPDGQWLVTGALEEYRFWRVSSWQLGHQIPRDRANLTGPMAFTHDGKLMAIALSSRTVQLINPVTGREIATLPAPTP